MKVYNNGPTSPIRTRAAKVLEDIINQIAKEEGLTEKRVNVILQSVFGTIADDIREGGLKGTHIIHLGKFVVKPHNIRRFLDKKNGSDA